MNKYVVIGAAAAGLGLAFVLYRGATKAAALAGDAAQAVNPLNNDNIFNQGATSLWQTLFNSTGTIGGDIYDATHGGALDVTSENNAVYRLNNSMWGVVTGDPKFDLGSKIYDWTH